MKLEDTFIYPDEIVTVTRMNALIEMQYMQKMNFTNNIVKISKNEYMIKDTGEIKEYIHTANRSEGINSLRQTFKKMRYLINNNFTGAYNELFLTLTYKENMCDMDRLYTDFKKFWQKLKRRYPNLENINVVEPQERGAWHCHVLIKDKSVNKLSLDMYMLNDLWGHGSLTIKRLQHVDNVGAYLSAYLANLEVSDDNEEGVFMETTDFDGKKTSKKIVKGGRLYRYPPGIHMYRKTSGMAYPNRVKMKYSEFKKRYLAIRDKKHKKIVEYAKPDFIQGITIASGVGPDIYENKIIYEQYNLKRAKVQRANNGKNIANNSN